MAPTEVLAWQHHLSISTALADLPVNVVLHRLPGRGAEA